MHFISPALRISESLCNLSFVLITAMESATVWGKLETSLHQGAITVEGSSTKQLFSPGVAGLQVMIESELGSGRVATEDITNFYETNDWDQNRCISWEELRSIVLSLNFPELQCIDEVDDEKKGRWEYRH